MVIIDIYRFVKETYIENAWNVFIRPRIFCMDGFNISVQGNFSGYCNPRCYTNKYDEMELGYPKDKDNNIYNEPLLSEYCGGNQIYGYVPIEIIDQIMKTHGGIDAYTTFKDCDLPTIKKYKLRREEKLKRILKN